MDDVDNLTGPQRAALGQLQAITNGADIPSEIAILSSVNWDVQRAAETIFDAQTNEARPKIEQMQVDDTAQGERHIPQPRRTTSAIVRIGLHIASAITWPISLSLNVLSHLVHFIFRILHIPFPRINFNGISFNFSPRGIARPPFPDDPASAADRLVRELEDETGAQVLSRARSSRRDEPGPSSAPAALDPLFDNSRKVLPDFWLGSYESALDVARRDARVLCVILLSSEHDDVPLFRKYVLTDPVFVRAVAENDVLVWAGDIRERDAYQASLKLTATTYPFVAFIALQPRVRSSSRGSGSSSASSPSLTILSRHAGATATTAPALAHHLATTLLPRHQPFLSRLQTQARAHENDRILRAEQDAAFAAAQQADAQRILQRRAEDAERARQDELLRVTEREQRRMAALRRLWRREALARLALAEGRATVRVGLRVPDGRREVRWFRESDAIVDLYAWVDDVLEEGHGSEGVEEVMEIGEEVPEWPFRLAIAFPRSEVPCVLLRCIGDVPALREGCNLVVESIMPVARDGSASEEED